MELTKSKSSDTALEMLEGGIRSLVRGNRSASAAEPCDDPLEAGATSIADIEKLMEELQIARDYLQSEGERVRQLNARYAHSAQTASASVKIIAESMGKWRKLDPTAQAPAALPRAPNLAPVHEGELQHESNDQ
jgi:hypothetical protein